MYNSAVGKLLRPTIFNDVSISKSLLNQDKIPFSSLGTPIADQLAWEEIYVSNGSRE
jgi:hypothetical protein